MSTYDKAYFIEKFVAIPDELWCTGHYTCREMSCALGHCDGHSPLSGEGLALAQLFERFPINGSSSVISDINDGNNKSYQHNTPKARVLSALYDLP